MKRIIICIFAFSIAAILFIPLAGFTLGFFMLYHGTGKTGIENKLLDFVFQVLFMSVLGFGWLYILCVGLGIL